MPPRAFKLSSHASLVIGERGITHQWIEECLASPEREESDRIDPALRHALKRIEAFRGRVLRVVYNPTVDPHDPLLVVTAFFDRSMKGKL